MEILEPTKGSFSKMRSKISWLFFKENFESLVTKSNSIRKTFRGFYIYAVDGHESPIPATEAIFSAGYRGCKRINNLETYYPRIYFSQLYDVLNGITVALTHSAKRNEHRDAQKLVSSVEANSITLYDRTYCSRPIMDLHIVNGSYFVFRCRRNSFLAIKDFYKSLRRQSTWTYNGTKIRLIKIQNPRTKEDIVVATNLSNEQMKNKEVVELYMRRWILETAIRDSIWQGFEQWHSKSENGLLQEVYARLWAINFARIQLASTNSDLSADFLKRCYKRANLKLVTEVLIECIGDILKGKFAKVLRLIDDQIRRTIQVRRRLSRAYPRVMKCSQKTSFTYNNVIPRRS